MTTRQQTILRYGLKTFAEALRRGCGYKWKPKNGVRPTREEIDKLLELLKVCQVVSIPYEQTAA
jgi:hypothetical protein